jgi:hypothetical protein
MLSCPASEDPLIRDAGEHEVQEIMCDAHTGTISFSVFGETISLAADAKVSKHAGRDSSLEYALEQLHRVVDVRVTPDSGRICTIGVLPLR